MSKVIHAEDRFHKEPILKVGKWRHPCPQKPTKDGKVPYKFPELRIDEVCQDCGKHPPSV